MKKRQGQKNMKKIKCPKCECECIITEAAVICPNCDYVHIKKFEWQGKTTKCPRCKKTARVYKNQSIGYTFECNYCGTKGRYIDESELHAKIISKSTELGKRLEWLFHVPTRIFHREDDILGECKECGNSHCPHCDAKKICETHKKEVVEFCGKHNIEVFITDEYIEIETKKNQ